MTEVAIVTDSTVCLPRELIKRYGIEVVPMELIHEGKVYKDGVDIAPTRFYQLLAQSEKLPTTSAPSVGTYFEALKNVTEKAKYVLIVAPSAKFSHAFDSAKAAAEMTRDKLQNVVVEVLDCGTGAGAQGFVVLAAAKAAALGVSLTRVIDSARNLMPCVHLIAFIDTLDYLAKGGRVPQIAAWASSFLKIKPIFELLPLSKGVTSTDRVRTRPRAVERLMELLRERVDTKPMHAIVMHTNALDEAKRLEERIVNEFNCVEVYVEVFTPVMGVHTGPGLLGVAFYNEN